MTDDELKAVEDWAVRPGSDWDSPTEVKLSLAAEALIAEVRRLRACEPRDHWVGQGCVSRIDAIDEELRRLAERVITDSQRRAEYHEKRNAILWDMLSAPNLAYERCVERAEAELDALDEEFGR